MTNVVIKGSKYSRNKQFIRKEVMRNELCKL